MRPSNSATNTSYRVERSTDGVTYATVADTLSGTATTYQVTGLAVNTAYHFRIWAYGAGGDAALPAETQESTLPDEFPPGPPACISVTSIRIWPRSTGTRPRRA